MKRTLAGYFIPHKGNNHKPHLLEIGALIVFIALALGIEAAFLSEIAPQFTGSKYTAIVLPEALVTQTNEARADNSLQTLVTNEVLVDAAQRKANDMAEKGYFSHITPDGKEPWYWLAQAGYDFSAAGENLAVNFTESEDVTEAWLNSPGHRANILNGNYTEIGIATAKGVYKGKNTVFVVEFFGIPKTNSVAVAPARVTRPEVVVDFVPEAAPVASEINLEKDTEPQSAPVANPEAPVSVKVAESRVEGAETEVEENVFNVLPPSVVMENPSTNARVKDTTYFVTAILGAIGALIGVVLVLKVLVNIKVQHPATIAHALIALLIIGSCIALNLSLA